MKTMIRTAMAGLGFSLAVSAMTFALPAQAASCTAVCAEKEAACIKRTNNKGQCGKQAKECTTKCK